MQLLGSNSWEGAGAGDSAGQAPARERRGARPGRGPQDPEAAAPSPEPGARDPAFQDAPRAPGFPPGSQRRDLGPRGRPGPQPLTCRSRTGAPAARCRLSCRPATLSAAPAIAPPGWGLSPGRSAL